MPQHNRRPVLRDGAITVGFLLLGNLLSGLLLLADPAGGFVSMIFVLMVALIARLTEGYVWGVSASFVGVICANYVFTYPYWSLNFTIAGYPLTFLTMLSVSLMVSTLTSQIKRQEQLRAESQQEALRANLLRAVSHDLRTPLTSIVGSASAILENDQALTQEQRTDLLGNIRDEGQWLIRMVENLLSITRMGDGAAHIRKELEAAEEVLASAAAKFQQRFPRIRLSLSAPAEPLFVPMDATLVEQVLLNLMENAAYHGRCETIRLSAQRRGQEALFLVQDDGAGIPEELLPRIFSPGVHGASPADHRRNNMGIGLSVCTSIVTAHGGALTAENVPAGGAAFRFTLPLEEKEENNYAYPG